MSVSAPRSEWPLLVFCSCPTPVSPCGRSLRPAPGSNPASKWLLSSTCWSTRSREFRLLLPFSNKCTFLLLNFDLINNFNVFRNISAPRRPTSPGPWSNPLLSAFLSPSPISALLTWTKESASWCTRSPCATPIKAGPSIWLIATTTSSAPWPENLSV